jgi:hypothetical protein
MTKDFLCFLRTASLLLLILLPAPAAAQTNDGQAGGDHQVAADDFKRFEVVFEPDAYYTNLELITALTHSPIQHVGEKTESEIYRTLLSGAAVLPRYLVLEASINPMPYLGVYIKKNHPDFYEDAQVSGSFNWIQALTAGFQEPWALSLLAGNVVGFTVPGNKDVKGNGYSGYLYSVGNYHIRNNELIHDRWQEIEWKMKGDRKSPVKKLSWSFRVGGKFHGNPYITDTVYLSFRRSRVDYQPETTSPFNNSGFEYTIDLNSKTFTPLRHYFYVEKKWPIEGRKIALALAVGFVWESASEYTGPLAIGQSNSFQFLLRPNIEF